MIPVLQGIILGQVKKKSEDTAKIAFGRAGEASSVSVSKYDQGQRIFLDDFYSIQAKHIENFLRQHDLVFSEMFFDLLKDLKAGKRRKDGVTPELAHEIDQILPIILSFESGILKDKWQEIEDKHGVGFIDKWIASVIGHDVGEDGHGLHKDRQIFFPETLEAEIRERLLKNRGIDLLNAPSDSELPPCLSEIVQRIENLTHYRKFSVKDFEKLTDIRLGCGHLEAGQTYEMGPDVTALFCSKMGRYERAQFYNPRVFVEAFANSQGKIVKDVIVTAYGFSNYNRVDWNRYARVLMDDLITGLVKGGDRINGMGTRIAIPEDVHSYAEYLRNTNHITRDVGIFHKLETDNLDSPLLPFLRSQKQMMKMLHRMGELVVGHHKDNNPEGGKGCDASAFDGMATEANEFTSLYFSEFLPDALDAFKHVPDVSHPVIVFMRQLQRHISKTQDTNLNNAFFAICRAIKMHGGSKIAERIQRFVFTNDISSFDRENAPSPNALL